MTIKDLQPACVWNIFDQITKVPRPSKKEGKIREWLINFAKENNIEYKVDEIGNVAMFRPAAPDLENAKGLILQAHMDMVCEKNKESNHDFDNDPIETIVEGEWIRANGTTLGADDGMGMAIALAVLTDKDLVAGPIEGFFTVDEETGLTGASNVGEGMLRGDYLCNLDSEDDGVITMSCAGGIDTLATFDYKPLEAPKDLVYFEVKLTGMNGGHSGTDINTERACATRLIARLLWDLRSCVDYELAHVDAGNLRNAIARDAEAVVGVNSYDKEKLSVFFNTFLATVKEEFKNSEPNLTGVIASVEAPAKVIAREDAERIINTVYAAPHGVLSCSLELEGLVETSTNLSSIKMKEEGVIEVVTSQRSAVESRKYDACHRVETVFKLGGGKVRHSDGYQGWAPNKNSKILQTAISIWKGLYGVEPKVEAIHAGLECGLFLKVLPHLDMISYGPTLKNVHSPSECCHIPAVQKSWDFTLGIIDAIAKEK